MLMTLFKEEEEGQGEQASHGAGGDQSKRWGVESQTGIHRQKDACTNSLWQNAGKEGMYVLGYGERHFPD